MKTKHQDVPQSIRLLYVLIYLIFLFLVNRLAFGQWLPLTSEKGLWFYAGAAALILGSLLVTPFFTSPANAISYLIAALVAVFVFPSSGPMLRDTVPRQCVIAFCLVMLAVCAFNILFKDSKKRGLHNVAEAGRQIADYLGRPRFVFAIIIAYSLWEYHRSSPTELLFVGLSGLVIASQQPLETIGSLIKRIIELWRPSTSPTVIGYMVAHQTPGMLLIRQEGDNEIRPGVCLLIADKHGPIKIGATLGYFGRDEGLLLRALEIEVPKKHRPRLVELGRAIPEGCVSVLADSEIEAFRDSVYPLKHLDSLIGIVASDSATERLYFEVIQEKGIEQGRLVETFVGGKRILYQVLDGLTKEEVIQQKNTYGFARGQAAQIGEWDEEKRKFMPCSWIPNIYAPVFLKNIESPKDNVKAVGYFPSTSYDVEIKNLDALVTHNTAILGILGVGKSMLAIELVERMISNGIKVICIDLTDQYAQELKLFKTDIATQIEQLKTLGLAGKTNYSKNVDEGGSKDSFAQRMNLIIAEFLDPTCKNQLMIFNPSQFEVWRQTSNWFKASEIPAMATLTPTGITQIISDATIQAVQKQGMTDKARVCLIYEEAHSLIPEWNSVVSEGDKAATNGTARAILQGRKYGLGCLLITQRTANVTKTILNQCNTISAMRTFDDTGKQFLANYLGGEYASKLPSLKERHAVFFGRASSCENPVMIRLNDQDDFRRVFRPPVQS
ncbi:MAG: DUF87 domain-containing protein [Kiritimatiellia bacterium]|jgi:hypothetical protein|nr:DUF87 domain-containing protein [Kiritimatiellia bacterium]